MATTVYSTNPASVKPTSLYEAGYRAHVNGIGKVEITTPDAKTYIVDRDFETCTCQGFYHSLRRGNPGCKHLEGMDALLARCEAPVVKPTNVDNSKLYKAVDEAMRAFVRAENAKKRGDFEASMKAEESYEHYLLHLEKVSGQDFLDCKLAIERRRGICSVILSLIETIDPQEVAA